MKTLDEVIKAFECCQNVECNECPYKILFNDDTHVPCDQLEKDEDAFHYLKEYRDKKVFLRYWSEKAISEHENITDGYMIQKKEDNPVLTWDELCTMEGKPVWVEYNLHLSVKDARSRMWIIVQKIMPWRQDDELIYYSGFVFSKKEIGKTWQAYRKERE